uniref:Uncharacterized protein n=1 Tax=Oryza brachyantha TaxID=4533 RepID=J3KVI9_ORYBR
MGTRVGVDCKLLHLGDPGAAADEDDLVNAVEQQLDLDAHLVLAAEYALGALALAAELALRMCVIGNVPVVVALDELDEVFHDALVEVLATEVCVAVHGGDLEQTVIDGPDTDVEHAITNAIRECGRGGLVEDEIHGRHGDNGVGDLLPEVVLRRLLHLDEHHGADLLGAEQLHGAVLHINTNMRHPTLVNDGEWQQLHVGLHPLAH